MSEDEDMDEDKDKEVEGVEARETSKSHKPNED